MPTDPQYYAIKTAFLALVDTLNSAASLQGFLTKAYPFFAHSVGNPEPGKCVLHCLVEDSETDIQIFNPAQNQTAETTFLIVLDCILNEDGDVFSSATNTSLLDHEQRVLTALQSVRYLGAENSALIWKVGTIARDVAIPDGAGGVDTQTPIRRTEIRIIVKCPLWDNRTE